MRENSTYFYLLFSGELPDGTHTIYQELFNETTTLFANKDPANKVTSYGSATVVVGYLQNLTEKIYWGAEVSLDFLHHKTMLSDIHTFHFDFSISPLHRRGDVGYKHRTSADGSYNDTKDFFHFHPALFERYEQFLQKEPQVNKFVQEAHAIWKVVFQTTKNVLGMMDMAYPGTSSKVLETQHPHILLRFLRYHWKKSQEGLAKPHFDAGSFTMAIAESGPGLRIGKSPESLVPVHHHADAAILMMASNQEKLLPESPWPAGWHDVVQLDERYLGHPYARWAVVVFIDAHGVDALPKSQTLHWHS